MNDDFSKSICQKCFEDSIVACELKKKCQNSDRILKNSKNQDIVYIHIPQSTTNDVKVESNLEPIVKTEFLDMCETVMEDTETNENDAEGKNFPDNYESPMEQFTSKIRDKKSSWKPKHRRNVQSPLWNDDMKLSKKELVPCELCGKMVTSRQMEDHKKVVHLNVRPFECDLCGKKMTKKHLMSVHVQRHIPKEHRERSFECELCHQMYLTKSGLRAHKSHSHKSPTAENHLCSCGKLFISKARLYYHIRYVHNRHEHESPCPHCGKVVHNSFIKQHIRINHTEDGQKNYMCNVCGKQFDYKRRLTVHQKSHGEWKFVCDYPGCEKKFYINTQLTQHKKITHLKQTNFSCPHPGCGKGFFFSWKLNLHYKICHEKIRVNCPVAGCKFSVGRRDSMRNHLKKHTELHGAQLEDYLNNLKHMGLI